MRAEVFFALLAGFFAGCVVCAGMVWFSRKRPSRKKTVETMKDVVWLCLCNGCAWVWCSYLLAYLGREEIAESLSQTAVAEIIGVVLAYALKSLFENLSKNNQWPDKGDKTKGV